MGRLLRPIDDSLLYHAINRGNDRRAVFTDPDEFHTFLDCLAQTQRRYPYRLYGYCLMTNHFHLLLRPEPGVTIGRVLQSLTVAHTYRFRRRHGTVGHVWQGRFRSPVIQDDRYLWTVLRYIEANPLRATMVADLAHYPWSSYLAHGEGRPDALLSPLPEWSGLGPDEPSRRSVWRQRVTAQQTDDDLTAIRHSLRTGRPFGEAGWRSLMTVRLGHQPQDSRRPVGRPRKTVSQPSASLDPPPPTEETHH